MNTQVRTVVFVVACLITCFVIAAPVAAVVAGVLHLIAPATFGFWMSFVYATIGCGAFNIGVSWRHMASWISLHQ